MRKTHLFCIALATIALAVSCDSGGYTDVSTPGIDYPINLSSEETANCYIVKPDGLRYRFDISVMGNGKATPGITPQKLMPMTAELLWQSEEGLITDVKYWSSSNGAYWVEFNTTDKTGNAVIAAYDFVDGNRQIVWSWHIWIPEDKVTGIKMVNGYEVMNMNLGAMANYPIVGNKAYGMLYQWGRKDPMFNLTVDGLWTGSTTDVGGPMYDSEGNAVYISSPMKQGSLSASIANPTTCYAGASDWLTEPNDSLWGTEKTIYDPCPPGWQVSPTDAFRFFTSTGGYVWTYEDMNIADINSDNVLDANDFNHGFVFWVSRTLDTAATRSDLPFEGYKDVLWFPAAGRYYGAYGMLYGSVCGEWGAYWSDSVYPQKGYAQAALAFAKDQCSASAGASRADAYSIRPVKTR